MARPGLTNNPKFRRLEHMLGLPRAHIWGLLEMLWQPAYETGSPIIGDAVDVELAAGWTEKPGELCEALAKCGGESRSGFIEPVPDQPGVWQIHDLLENAPEYVTSRSKKEQARKHDRRCEKCNATYRSTESHSKFCSEACRQAAHRAAKQTTPPAQVTPRDTVTDVTQCNDAPRDNVTHVTHSNAPTTPTPTPTPGKIDASEESDVEESFRLAAACTPPPPPPPPEPTEPIPQAGEESADGLALMSELGLDSFLSGNPRRKFCAMVREFGAMRIRRAVKAGYARKPEPIPPGPRLVAWIESVVGREIADEENDRTAPRKNGKPLNVANVAKILERISR